MWPGSMRETTDTLVEELCVCPHGRAWAAGAEEGRRCLKLTSKARPDLLLSVPGLTSQSSETSAAPDASGLRALRAGTPSVPPVCLSVDRKESSIWIWMYLKRPPEAFLVVQ